MVQQQAYKIPETSSETPSRPTQTPEFGNLWVNGLSWGVERPGLGQFGPVLSIENPHPWD